jgi:hypothetical protein
MSRNCQVSDPSGLCAGAGVIDVLWQVIGEYVRRFDDVVSTLIRIKAFVHGAPSSHHQYHAVLI